MQNAEFWICLIGCYMCFDAEKPTTFSRLMGWIFLLGAVINLVGRALNA